MIWVLSKLGLQASRERMHNAASQQHLEGFPESGIQRTDASASRERMLKYGCLTLLAGLEIRGG